MKIHLLKIFEYNIDDINNSCWCHRVCIYFKIPNASTIV